MVAGQGNVNYIHNKDSDHTLLHQVSHALHSGDTTPCRMTGVTLHSHVRYKEI